MMQLKIRVIYYKLNDRSLEKYQINNKSENANEFKRIKFKNSISAYICLKVYLKYSTYIIKEKTLSL